MPLPTLPDADALDGTEMAVIRQGGRLKRLLVSLLKGATGGKGDKGDKGDTGPAGPPKRVETYTGAVTGSAGVVTITFSPAFTAAPKVIPDNIVIGGQLYLGVVSAVTASGATVAFYRTKATLLLSASAVEIAPAGSAVSVTAIGS